MHIVYSAPTKADFILHDELDKAAKNMPSITITYREINTEGPLQRDDIVKVVKSLNEPDIYICGQEMFVSLVQKTLAEIQYSRNKIHVEEFVYAGAPVKTAQI